MSRIKTKLPGLKILLAEDYFINQELTRDILELMECSVDIVEDGNQAIEKYQENRYDLILMDIQMPNLDGFSAAREIRNIEKKTGAHIPIVALTANALSGDAEKCYAAGMDSYISKPLDPKKLEDLLKNYFRDKVVS
ncbi:MAG: hypothetical protein Tsb0021_03250 [Chlamydiales bacterium]